MLDTAIEQLRRWKTFPSTTGWDVLEAEYFSKAGFTSMYTRKRDDKIITCEHCQLTINVIQERLDLSDYIILLHLSQSPNCPLAKEIADTGGLNSINDPANAQEDTTNKPRERRENYSETGFIQNSNPQSKLDYTSFQSRKISFDNYKYFLL
jgi:hypothetical protein